MSAVGTISNYVDSNTLCCLSYVFGMEFRFQRVSLNLF